MSDPARTPLAELDPVEAWKPWQPDAARPWDRKWAGHLYRRAAFGASWDDLDAAVRDGPEATLQRLFAGGPGHEDFDELMDALAPYYVNDNQPNNEGQGHRRLQDWWLYRMILTPHPLRERLTLFWHNHFATSIAKVRLAPLMLQQNALLRRHALGKFGPFLLEISRDPAMLVWLDSNSNVKAHPNENYAREIMELFSLGVGNYTEHDVREAARAFTGWHTSGGKYRFSALSHDDGTKTVLGRTGKWDGGDIVRIILEQPAAARFLVRKFYRHFVGESETPPDRLIEPLAERFRRSDYDVADLLGTMLRSRHFFSDHAYRQRIKSPAEYVVSLFRSFGVKPEGEGLANNGVPLPAPLDGLGQQLFAPPNVKGWDGGRAWLNTATVLARHNFAWKFLQGAPGSLGAHVDLPSQVREHAGAAGTAGQVDFLLDLLLQGGKADVSGPTRRRLLEFLGQGDPDGPSLDRRLRETAHTILLLPEYQLA
jgi:uncharacterized protein (DUF1800 family)